MELSDLLRKVAEALDSAGVAYAVVGSLASIAYGEPRFTNDIDVVVDLQPSHVAAFCAQFPAPDFYLSRPAVESAVQTRSMFNILHPASGFKVDCIVASDAFDRSELARAVARPTAGDRGVVRFATPEDVIVKKLEYFRLGESEKHLRDIAGIVQMQGERIDREYIRQWAERTNVLDIWEALLVRLAEGGER